MIKRNTWIMIGVLGLLLVATYLLQQSGNQADPAADLPTQPVSPLVFDLEMTEITGLRIANLDGQSVSLQKTGDVWVLAEPQAEADQVDQGRIEGLLAQLAAMRYLTEARINAPIEALQLEFAPHVLTVTTSSGESLVMKIGEVAPTQSGYYIAFEDNVPRLVARNPLDQAISFLANPPLLPTPIPVEELPSP